MARHEIFSEFVCRRFTIRQPEAIGPRTKRLLVTSSLAEICLIFCCTRITWIKISRKLIKYFRAFRPFKALKASQLLFTLHVKVFLRILLPRTSSRMKLVRKFQGNFSRRRKPVEFMGSFNETPEWPSRHLNLFIILWMMEEITRQTRLSVFHLFDFGVFASTPIVSLRRF